MVLQKKNTGLSLARRTVPASQMIQPTFFGPCTLAATLTMFAAALPFTATVVEHEQRFQARMGGGRERVYTIESSFRVFFFFFFRDLLFLQENSLVPWFLTGKNHIFPMFFKPCVYVFFYREKRGSKNIEKMSLICDCFWKVSSLQTDIRSDRIGKKQKPGYR